VNKVIAMAEQILDRGEKLYCLGQIVHNEAEAERLERKGMIFIDHNQFSQLFNARVLIRAHGEPPSTYKIAEEQNIELIDGTCPIVLKSCSAEAGKKTQVIIYGKENHPEVIALRGQTDNKAFVVKELRDLEKIRIEKEVELFSQTTMSIPGFKQISDTLEKKILEKYGTVEDFHVHNTICGHVSHRKPGLMKFATDNEIVVFVAGKSSSNGKVLFDVCKKANERSFFISSPIELKKEWFHGVRSTGICGATSTPRWLMEEVASAIKKLT
jgi:4-hydroxy-3-methylbut-2-enyl diphosphate reductase